MKTQEEQTPKKPYSKPELTVHGDVEEITQYISGQNSDDFGGSQPG